MEKKELVAELLAAKDASGKTWDELADALGYCNVYVAQLFHNQAQLKPKAEPILTKLVPGLTKEHLNEMRKCPMRSYDPFIILNYRSTRMESLVNSYSLIKVGTTQGPQPNPRCDCLRRTSRYFH